jgi:methionyl aminopeptidase
MINIKSKQEIEIMKEGGKIAAHILKKLAEAAKPEVTTKELDDLAEKEIKKSGAEASFLGHAGYPASICTSINSQVVHGVPSFKDVLKENDIIGIDLGIFYKGFHTDTALTVGVGKIDFERKQLIKVAKEALDKGIGIVKPGISLGDVQNRIQAVIEGAGFAIIRDLAGHGIGRNLQEDPSIPNFGQKESGPVLKEGMVLALEPMITNGDWHVKILADGWTVVTVDDSLSAHFEHTVAVTGKGYEILTMRNGSIFQ